MKVTDTVKYLGVDDTDLDLFESQYPIPNGVTYNSYLIEDEKLTVMDTVDKRGSEQWRKNLKDALGGRKPAYLIVQHLEPDHSANIGWLADEYPEMKLVGSAKTKQMLPQFFEKDYTDRFIAVKEGDELSLGSHTLQFFMAPMVHWPEVMVTYEKSEKTLFSADGFGTFGTIKKYEDGHFDESAEMTEGFWICEARRYFCNIVGKYGGPVQTLLKKAATLDIARICPLHGPVLSEDLGYYIDKYQHWSTYTPEESGILLAYASIHGNTKDAVLQFAKELEAKGEKVIRCDLTREHVSYAVENAFRYDRMILAACTYDGNLFPPMEDFLYHLKCKAIKNRRVGLIQNGSWGPIAAKYMKEYIDALHLELVEPIVTIKTMRKPSDDAQFQALADAICK
ncbi:MAG: FprA family A-type flavoprotein [Lachnospiraceae bacterium]|uniref:FprA family A-type flavoprotein n=1 Tax=Candidatus Weimeria bifida TaxID=2599074 RepID=A0A6N7J0B1_9FIRM|nr:FprA family A-type flavoprotein [Candidatus Weimeria bifida]RRF96734.1 MAG: FprA family A-type flavoprotein [Lachnospiraceae bacterium]